MRKSKKNYRFLKPHSEHYLLFSAALQYFRRKRDWKSATVWSMKLRSCRRKCKHRRNILSNWRRKMARMMKKLRIFIGNLRTCRMKHSRGNVHLSKSRINCRKRAMKSNIWRRSWKSLSNRFGISSIFVFSKVSEKFKIFSQKQILFHSIFSTNPNTA